VRGFLAAAEAVVALLHERNYIIGSELIALRLRQSRRIQQAAAGTCPEQRAGSRKAQTPKKCATASRISAWIPGLIRAHTYSPVSGVALGVKPQQVAPMEVEPADGWIKV